MLKLITITFALSFFGASTDTREVLTELAYEQIMQHFDATDYRFELTPRWIPNSLLQANPSDIQSVQLNEEIAQYTRFEVRFKNQTQVERVQIQFKVEAEQRVPVAIERIISGETISAGQVEMQWVEFIPGRDRFVLTIESLIGNSSRRLVNPGNPFRENEVSSPLLVKAGEPVLMRYEHAGIELALTCESRQSGSRNEEITIYCPETRKKYTVEIQNTGEAVWLRTM